MTRRRSRPNVLLLVCDSLRPDYTSPYGSDIDTPFFDRLASRGIVFERAYAAGPGSSISHAALFTGQYPSTNGVGGQVDVPTDVPHIAARFRDAGYDTFGMPGPSRIGSHWKYDRGFDEYLEKWADIPSSLSLSLSLEDLRKGIADPALLKPMPREFLRSLIYGDDEHASYLLDVFADKTRSLEDPWFSFINVTIAHAPYDPPRPYKQQAIPGLERPRLGALDRFGEEIIENPDIRASRINAVQSAEGFAKYYSDNEYLTDTELETLRSLYAASVRYLDDQLSELFSRLETAGALDNTIVVMLTDHGEYLGERGLTGHMFYHFDPCLHVPLIISGPNIPERQRRSDLVSLVDVFPTLCDLVDVERPSSLDGCSLFGVARRDAVFAENGLRDTPKVFDEHFSAETVDRLKRGVKSIRTADYLYTLDSEGDEQLHEFPAETEVAKPDPEVLTHLRWCIEVTLGTELPPGSQEDDYSQAIEDDLRHLGYLG